MQKTKAAGSKALFFSHIDGLRGIAVLSVLAFHLQNHWLPSGFLGVDIFFVISGFVVSHSVRRFVGPFRLFLLEFYRRRILRIFPPLLTCLFFTGTMAALFIPGPENHIVFARVSRAAHFAMSNFAMIKESANYFSPSGDFNPLTHTWSLAIEEQFYLLFPFLFFFLFLRPQKKNYGVFAFVGLLLLSLGWFLFSKDQLRNFYAFLPRIWELAWGVVIYLLSDVLFGIHNQETRKPDRLFGAVSVISLGMIGFALFQVREENGAPLAQLASVFFTGVVLLLLRSPGSNSFVVTRALNTSPLRWVGRISYSLYLFHWPVIVLIRWTLGMESWTSILFAGILSFALGTISFYFIETPMKGLSHQNQDADTGPARHAEKMIGFGLLAVFVSLLLTQGLYYFQEKISLTRTAWDSENWVHAEKFLGSQCLVKEYISKEGILVFRVREQDKSACVTTGKKLFVIGDSHAGAYSTLFRKIAQKEVSEVQVFSIPGCTSFNMLLIDQTCLSFVEKSLKTIAELGSEEDLLFLPGLRLLRLTDYHAQLDPNATRARFETSEARAYLDEVVQTALPLLRPVLDKRLRVILEAPKPLFRISAYRCVDRFNQMNPICHWGFSVDRSELLNYRQPAFDTLTRITGLSSLIEVWDPFPILCPKNSEDTCSPLRGTDPLYFDYDHLAAFGNTVLYPSFAEVLKSGDAQ